MNRSTAVVRSPAKARHRAVATALSTVLATTACTIGPSRNAETADPIAARIDVSRMGIDIARGMIEGSHEDGLMFGSRYYWTLEELPQCESGVRKGSILSGTNPLSRTLLSLASEPYKSDILRSAFLDETKNGIKGDWITPWQQSLCDPLDVEALTDPIVAGMRPQGGEGLSLCDSFPALLCMMEVARRAGWSPSYANYEVRRLLLEEIDWQRQSFSEEQRQLTNLLELVIDYDHHFDARVTIRPRDVSVPSIGIGPSRSMPIGPVTPHLAISAIFLRAVYVGTAKSTWDNLILVVNAQDNQEAVFSMISAAADQLRSDFRRAWRFALAHELAHFYLGNARAIESNELLADCVAILELSKRELSGYGGAFDLIERAYAERVENYFGVAQGDQPEYERRREAFRRTLDAVKTAGSGVLGLSYCKQQAG